MRACRVPPLTALAHAEPAVFWLDDAAAPGPAAGAGRRPRRPTSSSWVAATPDCGPPCRPRRTTRRATSSCSRRTTVGWAASGRNGGFCAASLTHGEANGLDRFPEEFDRLQRWGRRTSTASRTRLRRHRIDAEFERTGELDFAVEPWQVDDLRELVDLVSEHGGNLEVPRRRAGPRAASTRRRTSPRCTTPTASRWSIRPSSPGVCGRHVSTWASGSTSTPRSPASRRTASALRLRTAVRLGAGAEGRARHQRLHRPAQATAPLRRAGLRLRAGHRAAVRRAARGRSAGRAGRGWPTPPTSSTTTGSPPTTGSSGAATTRSTTTAARCAPEYDHRPATYALLAEQFFDDLPAAGGSRVHPPLGRRDRHLQPVHGVLGPGVRAAGWPTSPATPASASASSRFGARVMLDLVDGLDTERTAAGVGAQQAAAVPARADALRRDHRRPSGRSRQADRNERPAQPVAAHARPAWGWGSSHESSARLRGGRHRRRRRAVRADRRPRGAAGRPRAAGAGGHRPRRRPDPHRGADARRLPRARRPVDRRHPPPDGGARRRARDRALPAVRGRRDVLRVRRRGPARRRRSTPSTPTTSQRSTGCCASSTRWRRRSSVAAPWPAPEADEWDRITVGAVVRRRRACRRSAASCWRSARSGSSPCRRSRCRCSGCWSTSSPAASPPTCCRESEGGAQTKRFVGGTAQIPQRLADRARRPGGPDAPVLTIEYSADAVTVTCRGGVVARGTPGHRRAGADAGRPDHVRPAAARRSATS